ncbi:MAG TPA: ATP-binding protein [Myxococcota bacterium]|nr:ATP-binding protein [Myxococcota bacterium]
MDGSIDRDVGRWKRILDRLERVLGLAERALEPRVGPEPGPALFERAVAFRWDARRGAGRLRPIERPQLFDLEDLVCVDRAIDRLVANTEQFLAGLPFNHVLLYGERGTGKSSAVRGLLERYADRGLRIVELHRADLLDLPDVLELLGRTEGRPARSEPKAIEGGPQHGGGPLRFLIFCDDLSFDAGDPGYRELKAALEGSLAAPAQNVCIAATSNRRHLIQERVSDNAQIGLDAAGDLQVGETVDEKLALSDRFGLVIGFYAFDQDAYLEVVKHYAAKAGLETPWEELRADALRWALRRASRSGRSARQFVDDLAGRKALARTR